MSGQVLRATAFALGAYLSVMGVKASPQYTRVQTYTPELPAFVCVHAPVSCSLRPSPTAAGGQSTAQPDVAKPRTLPATQWSPRRSQLPTTDPVADKLRSAASYENPSLPTTTSATIPAETTEATTAERRAVLGRYHPVRLWTQYMDLLERAPLRTKIITALLTSIISDAVAQYITYPGPSSEFHMDFGRSFIFVALNGLYGAPCGHYWFNFLDYLIKRPDIAKRLPKPYGPVVFQMVLDQTISACMVNSGFLLLFWACQDILHGDTVSVASLTHRLGEELWPMMQMNWKLWPLAKLISFSMVPLNLRVFYANIISIGWTAFLSATANHASSH